MRANGKGETLGGRRLSALTAADVNNFRDICLAEGFLVTTVNGTVAAQSTNKHERKARVSQCQNNKRPRVARVKPRDMESVYRDSEKRLVKLISDEGGISDHDIYSDDGPHVPTIRFYKGLGGDEDLGGVAYHFDSVADPVLTAELRGQRWLIVLDESAVIWRNQAPRAQRGFCNNVMMAPVMFPHVIVFCSYTRADIEQVVSRMDEFCRERVRIESGALHAKTIEGLVTGRAAKRTRPAADFRSP